MEELNHIHQISHCILVGKQTKIDHSEIDAARLKYVEFKAKCMATV